MLYYLTKIAVTAILVVLISELAKRSTLAGALLASIPLTSVLAILWLYIETGDIARIASLTTSVFWLVLPSLVFFILLPLLLLKGVHFYLSLAIALGSTAACYGGMILLLGYLNIEL